VEADSIPFVEWKAEHAVLRKLVGVVLLTYRLAQRLRGHIPVRPLRPFGMVCTYFMLVHMSTGAELRYSEPLHPLLAIILMAAGKEGFDWFARTQSS
jgi:hypothetical protein